MRRRLAADDRQTPVTSGGAMHAHGLAQIEMHERLSGNWLEVSRARRCPVAGARVGRTGDIFKTGIGKLHVPNGSRCSRITRSLSRRDYVFALRSRPTSLLIIVIISCVEQTPGCPASGRGAGASFSVAHSHRWLVSRRTVSTYRPG